MYGQQSLTPPAGAVTSGFGGGQLIEAALTVLVRAAAWGQAAAGPAVSAIATAASTTVLASLAGGRGAGRACLSRCGCLGFISVSFAADCAGRCMPSTREGRSAAGAAA